MKWSLKIVRLAGIDIFMHWTFMILIAWVIFSGLNAGESISQSLLSVVFILTLFACVVFHELGHALTARRFGITTKNIVLLPIGGIANLEKMPDKPEQELWVALAGPAVNVVIAAIIFLVLLITDSLPDLSDMEITLSSSNFLYSLLVVNVMLVLFNLIPAFPMDGGRVLRALLAMKYSRAKATEIAARTGQVLAMFFVFLGLFYNVWLMFIGLFVFLGADAESKFEATRSVLSKYTVADVLMKQYTVLHAYEPIEEAVKQLLNGQEKEFLVTEDNEITGIITRDEIISGLSKLGKTAPIGNITNKNFLRLTPDMALDQAFESMMKSGTTFNPVFENGELTGVLDSENITELIMVDQAIVRKT